MSKLAEALRTSNTNERSVLLEPMYTSIKEDYQKNISPYAGLYTTYSISATVAYQVHISYELMHNDPKALQAVTDAAKEKIVNAFFEEFRHPLNNLSRAVIDNFGYSERTKKVLDLITDLQIQMFDYRHSGKIRN